MNRAHGFTLVEMLVGLFVFGLIAASSVVVMAHAVDNQDVVRERMARLGELQATRALLQADLGQVARRRVRDADGRVARRAFVAIVQPGTGQPLALRFVRRGWRNPDGHPRASLQRVEYRVRDGRLERLAHPALDGARADPPQVLIEGIREASLRFRHRGEWGDGWPGGADDVPEAVALRLDLQGFGPVEQLFLLPGSSR